MGDIYWGRLLAISFGYALLATSLIVLLCLTLFLVGSGEIVGGVLALLGFLTIVFAAGIVWTHS